MRSSRLRCVRPTFRVTPAYAMGVVVMAASAAMGVTLIATRAAAGVHDATAMRVLLYRGPGPVEVAADGRASRFEASAEGVRRDGRETRSSFELESGRELRVAGRRVTGSIRVGLDPEAKANRGAVPSIIVVNRIGLEQYVAGVLEGEIPASWAPEALAAQAVASRSYALHERARRADAPWHVTATTAHQVYAESADVHDAIREAVRQTAGEVLTHGGRPILAAFHSASGGRTASADEVWGRALPYLVSRDVIGEEDSPDTYWRAGVSLDTFGELLDSAGVGVGAPRSIVIGERTASGRVASIEIEGTKGRRRLSGRELRSIIGEATLRSTLFDVRAGEDSVVFVGTGRGHGVGMSQWGAQALAREGLAYREILEAFYPGTRLEHLNRAMARRP